MACCNVPPSSSHAAGRRELALLCTIAAASFTCGVWFARAALPPPRRGSFEDSAAHADAYEAPAGTEASGGDGDPELVMTWSFRELRDHYKALAVNASASQVEVARLKQELAVARAQALVAANTGGGAQPPSDAPGTQPAAPPHNPLEERFYPLDPRELSALAKSCTIRVDAPKVFDSTPGDVAGAADVMSATPDEVRAMNHAMRVLHASYRDRLRALYAEALGHPADTELSARALLSEMYDKRPPENADLFADIAKERAGQKAAPAANTDATPFERAERMSLSLGDEFQHLVAQAVGPERASTLRAAGGGWTWSRSQYSGCDR